MINVSKTNLPPLKEYIKKLEGIWDSKWITNHGQQTILLENKLKELFNVKHLFLVSNGTLALQIAIKALGLKGEIITTPFSYVATTSSIVWEGCIPVFCDIGYNNLTIDPEKIESLITKKTSAIIATHVFGVPCNIEKINKIARKHNLRVIYDAAHAFGVRYHERSIMNYGDVSTLSFHATKLFHTAEGGAVVTNNDDVAHKISYMRNFGHNGYEGFWGLGINGKMSELHAALGLCMFPKVRSIIGKYKKTSQYYDTLLSGHGLVKPIVNKNTEYNYAYYPVLFPSEKVLLKVQRSLNAHDICPRRYFYPSLNTLKYLDHQSAPIAEDVSKRILCLPLYTDLNKSQVKKITRLIIDEL